MYKKHCKLNITASNMARHMKLKHVGLEEPLQEEADKDPSSDFREEEGFMEEEEEEEAQDSVPIPCLTVHRDAARFTDVLQRFHAYLLTRRPVAEALTTVRVVEHFLLYAVKQPPPEQPEDGLRHAASEVDFFILQVGLYPDWLKTGTLGERKPGTRRAYLSRFIRFLNWRLTQVGHLLDPKAAAVREATRGLLHYLQSLKQEEHKAARADQRQRLTKEEHMKHNRWCSVKNLVDALRVNRPQFDACVTAAAAADDMRLADRSFCTSYVLAALSVLVSPARPGFWENLDMQNFRNAVASGDRLLSSTKFKTQAKYGVKTVELTEEVVGIIQAYCDHVRPYCRPQFGVLAGVKLAAAGTDPLFLNPLAGGRLTSMSSKVGAAGLLFSALLYSTLLYSTLLYYPSTHSLLFLAQVETFFFKVLGINVNVSRVRMIMHTACQTSQSSKSLGQYQRGDTHSSAVAEMNYLKLSAAEVAKDSSKIHERLLRDEEELEVGAAPAPLAAPGPGTGPGPGPAAHMRFCGHCGSPSTNTPFCGHCGVAQRGAPVAPSSPHTPPRKRRHVAMEGAVGVSGEEEDTCSKPTIQLSPPGTARRRHVKVPWRKDEVVWVRDWVSANPPAADGRGRLTFRWTACALEGKSILQPAHQRGTHVRSCYRSFLKGAYTVLLEE